MIKSLLSSKSEIAGITVETLISSISNSCLRILSIKNDKYDGDICKDISEALLFATIASFDDKNEDPDQIIDIDEELIKSVLAFNTDKERLEKRIRLCLIAEFIDRY